MPTLQRPRFSDGMAWGPSSLPRLQFSPQMALLQSLSGTFPSLRVCCDVRENVRLASDNGAYTYKDFERWYGEELGMKRWQEAWPACPQARKLAAILSRFDFRVKDRLTFGQ